MEKFQFKIKTSNRYLTAGTKHGINVKLTGVNGASTEWKTLGSTSFFSETFPAGSTKEFEIQNDGNYIGAPEVLTLKLSGFGLDYWLCDTISVEYEKQFYTFLVYDWVVKEELVITIGEAKLPQKLKNKFIRSIRNFEIENNSKKYEWVPQPTPENIVWGINRHINASHCFNLPNLCRRTYGRLKCLGTTGLYVLYQTGANIIKGSYMKISTLDEFRALYKPLGRKDPEFIERWKTDEEMGRQVLNGISPLEFSRCDSVPSHCNISDIHVKSLLPKGTSLSSQIEARKIYIADYSRFTKNVERNINSATGEPFVCADCIGLFYYRENGDFVPLAIQLEPDNPESIFTKLDSEYDWLLAKMYFRSTMQVVHEWIHHFLYTHAVSETFAVATFRCFPRSHPLYKLLRPHLDTVASINTDARFVIFPKGSLANKTLSLDGVGTMRKEYKTFHLDDLDIPKVLEKNGTKDRHQLPNYYYRDDALDLWAAMEKYIGNIIRFFYHCEKDIEEDYELQNWIKEVASEGFAWQDGNTRGIPNQISSVSQLIHLCTIIIFTSSAQHAAVNFGQLETYQFVPNSPGAMRLPIHKKGEGSLERILNTLPTVTISSLAISFSYALSEFAEDEIYLGEFPEKLFLEPEIVNMQDEFTKDLKKLTDKFKERNETIKYPYTYLLPEKIPNSIAI